MTEPPLTAVDGQVTIGYSRDDGLTAHLLVTDRWDEWVTWCSGDRADDSETLIAEQEDAGAPPDRCIACIDRAHRVGSVSHYSRWAIAWVLRSDGV